MASLLGFVGRMSVSAAFLGLAALRGGPGVMMHLRAWRMAAAIFRRTKDPARRSAAYGLLVFPMDSVRYFELDFAWQAIRQLSPPPPRYVDVSSPRLLPVAVVLAHPGIQAILVNPDTRDLEATRALVDACGIGDRCRLEAARTDRVDIPPGSVDLVTSISVVEHIPLGADVEAVARMWSWLRPGGRLVLTVPCARRPQRLRAVAAR
jgi:SAM-dependent methyltransferase